MPSTDCEVLGMNRSNADVVRNALKLISIECKITSLCDNCPLYKFCQGDHELLAVRPDKWEDDYFMEEANRK